LSILQKARLGDRRNRESPEAAQSKCTQENPWEKSWLTLTNLVAEHQVKRGSGNI